MEEMRMTFVDLFYVAIAVLAATNLVLSAFFQSLRPLLGIGLCIIAILYADIFRSSPLAVAGVIASCVVGTHIGGLFAFREARKAKRQMNLDKVAPKYSDSQENQVTVKIGERAPDWFDLIGLLKARDTRIFVVFPAIATLAYLAAQIF